MTSNQSRGGREKLNIIYGVVILAAGASSRMGKQKLLLPWGDTSVLGYLIGQWEAPGAKQIAVVHGTDDKAIGSELDRSEERRVGKGGRGRRRGADGVT